MKNIKIKDDPRIILDIGCFGSRYSMAGAYISRFLFDIEKYRERSKVGINSIAYTSEESIYDVSITKTGNIKVKWFKI